MGNLLYTLLVGLIAGFLADLVVKNRFGLIGDLIVGVIGSFIGVWLFRQLGISIGQGLVGEIITAFAGAVLLLVVVNFFRRK
jgi:uncharacterized membrane protein YeaQ/YmgE (transglycosylase-associated protein family)